MKPPPALPTVGIIEECRDLTVDACIVNDTCDLVFLSVWGRDTAIQELLARISLPVHDALALRTLNLEWETRHSPVFLNPEAIDKRATRSFPGTLFGSLQHLWLFDRQLVEPDHANASAFILAQPGQGEAAAITDRTDRARIWAQVQHLAPYPLLDAWDVPVMQAVSRHEMITPMRTLFGPVRCWHIGLDVETLQGDIGALIRSGQLTTAQAA